MAAFSLSTETVGTPQVMTTTYKTLMSLTSLTGATTLRKAEIYDAMMGASGTPADNALIFIFDRQTTVGTATAATPMPLDGGDAAALIVGNCNHTVEPTITANSCLLAIPLNQRATYRWQSYDDRRRLVVPATTVTGIGLRAKSAAYTGVCTATIHFDE